VVDTGGRRWRIDTYADMAIRSARHNAATEGKIRAQLEQGWRAGGRVFAPVVARLRLWRGGWNKTAYASSTYRFCALRWMSIGGLCSVVTSAAVATGANHRTVVQDAMRRVR
ncbi:hypothetical protein ACNQUF_12325, partial [Corynebacterium diphtheriae]